MIVLFPTHTLIVAFCPSSPVWICCPAACDRLPAVRSENALCYGPVSNTALKNRNTVSLYMSTQAPLYVNNFSILRLFHSQAVMSSS